MQNKRHIVYGALLLGISLSGLFVLNPTAAQSGPDGYATAKAGVQSLFTATAQASAYSTFSLTVESMFQQALTETAQVDLPPTVEPTSSFTPTITPSPGPTNAMTMTAFAANLLTTTITPTLNLTDYLPTLGGETMRIDGGTFQMGTTPQEVAIAVNECINQGGNCQIAFGEDSAPPHAVTVSGFSMERLEVTYAQYLAFLNRGGNHNICDAQRCVDTQAERESSNIFLSDGRYQVSPVIAGYPVANVTWYGADAYCRAIGRRLPTEAEWERAARGPDDWIYPWGNEWNSAFAKTSISPTDDVGAVPGGSLGGGRSYFGVLDMAGNMAEWVADWYDAAFYTNPLASGLDPKGPPAGEEKVIRGGSWDAKPFFARSVHRQSANPGVGYAWVGFRCVEDFYPVTPTTLPPTLTFTPPSVQISPSATPTPDAIHTLPPPPIQATPTATPT
jgi:formylglycine-generating enzyme required for sulfatase activity